MSEGDDRGIEQRQAQIEATRRRVALEMNELADRFKPAVVKQRAEERVLAVVASFVDLARRRPALTASVLGAIAAVAVGMALLRRRQREDGWTRALDD